MNSMYGRFGMQTAPVKDEIVTPQRAIQICRDYQVQNSITIGELEFISYILDLPITEHAQIIPQ